MNSPFGSDDRERDGLPGDTERDDFAPRIPEDEQGIDALLRTGGEQWRASVPAVEFDRPSSRVAMLGRGPRVVVSLGIAAAVVAIVLAGSALIGRPAASVGPQAPTGGSSAVPTPMNSATASTLGTLVRSTELTVTSPPPSSAPADVTQFTEDQRSGHLVSTEADPAQASKVFGATPFPPVDSEVWTGWDVGTGRLLVGVKDGNCASTFNGLRLADLHRLTLQVTLNRSADVYCSRGWTVASFSLPSGFDPWVASQLVTPLGTTSLAPISGVVQNPADDTIRTAGSIGASPMGAGSAGSMTVRWVPDSSALVITAPARCASSIDGLTSEDRGATLRVVGVPDDCTDAGGPPLTVAVTTPPRSERGFTVLIAGRAFTVPAIVLPRGRSTVDEADIRWITVPAQKGKAQIVSRVGRTPDDRVIVERVFPAQSNTSAKDLEARQIADQVVVIRPGAQSTRFENALPDPLRELTTFVLQPHTDASEPITVVLGDDRIELPAVG